MLREGFGVPITVQHVFEIGDPKHRIQLPQPLVFEKYKDAGEHTFSNISVSRGGKGAS
jgi:hypothetical protein